MVRKGTKRSRRELQNQDDEELEHENVNKSNDDNNDNDNNDGSNDSNDDNDESTKTKGRKHKSEINSNDGSSNESSNDSSSSESYCVSDTDCGSTGSDDLSNHDSSEDEDDSDENEENDDGNDDDEPPKKRQKMDKKGARKAKMEARKKKRKAKREARKKLEKKMKKLIIKYDKNTAKCSETNCNRVVRQRRSRKNENIMDYKYCCKKCVNFHNRERLIKLEKEYETKVENEKKEKKKNKGKEDSKESENDDTEMDNNKKKKKNQKGRRKKNKREKQRAPESENEKMLMKIKKYKEELETFSDHMEYYTHSQQCNQRQYKWKVAIGETKELKTFEDALDCIYDKWDKEYKSAIYDGIDLFCQKAFNGNASYQLPIAIKNVICLNLRPRMIVRPYWRPQTTEMLADNVYLDKIDSLREELAYLKRRKDYDSDSDDDDNDKNKKSSKQTKYGKEKEYKKELNEKLNAIKLLNNKKEKEYGDIKILFSSKFGGLPYLSKNDEWPKCGDKDCQRRMVLFFQINFDQLPNEFMNNKFILPFLHQNEYKGCLIQLFYCVNCLENGDAYGDAFSKSQHIRLIKIKKDEKSKEKGKGNENKNENGLTNLIDDYKEVSEIKKIYYNEVIEKQLQMKDGIYDESNGEDNYCGKEGFGYFIENWIKCNDKCNTDDLMAKSKIMKEKNKNKKQKNTNKDKSKNKNKKKKKKVPAPKLIDKNNYKLYQLCDLPHNDDLQAEFSKCFEHKLVPNMVTRYNRDDDNNNNDSDENEDIDISENDKKKKKGASKDDSEPVEEMDPDEPMKVESKVEFTNKFMENDGFEEIWENWDDCSESHFENDSSSSQDDSDSSDGSEDSSSDDNNDGFKDSLLTKQMQCRHNKIGGYPKWCQGIYYPSCKVDNCHESMNVFLFQFEPNILGNEITFGEDGIGYLVACPNHPKSITFLWSSY